MRVPVVVPPAANHCPEITSQLVAEERAQEYAEAGTHYETRLVFTLTWLPPSDVGQKFSNFFFPRSKSKKQSRLVLLSIFQAQAKQLIDALGHFLELHRLEEDELMRFLRYCVTGEDRTVGVDQRQEMLDYAIGATTIDTDERRVGKLHTRVVGVYGFPRGTSPQLLDDLLQLPFTLRISQRFIFLSPQKAVKELEIKRNKWKYRNWYNPRRIGWGATQNVTKVDPNSEEVIENDDDADEQARSVKREITKLREGRETGGYYTLVVVLQAEDEEQVEQHAAEIMLLLNRKGFTAVNEMDNWPYALRGSWPGHGTENVRQPRLTTRHLARLWPTSTPWRGHEQHPSPLYPPKSQPLLICQSTGHTPFCFTPRLHSLTIGPTSNGKTVLFNAMATAHLQYERAQVNFFDRDAGAVVPTFACGGEYFDLDAMRYSPLAHIDEEDEMAWAVRLIEKLASLRKFSMTPQASADVMRALRDLSHAPMAHRTITGLLGQLQTHDRGLAHALSYYAGNAPGAVLDGPYTPTMESHWLTFDMEKLMERGPEVSTPVLMTQIHLLGRKMDGRPTQLFFDEGWMAVGDELLRDYMEQSSATMRKKVVSMHLVLHSPGNLSYFPHADLLLANVGTYVFLPNPEANTPAMRKYYSDLGLGSRVIRKLAEDLRPRRDYLVKEGNQIRVFQLPWGPWASALLGCNGRDEKRRIVELRKHAGEQWLPAWLMEKGQAGLATQWNERHKYKEAA
jgi:type IV secretion system protein VirB4